MEAARDKWQNICTTVEHQTVAINKKPTPRMASRNIEKLDGLGMELREAYERVELVLSKAIKRGVCKDQDEERLKHMNEKYTRYSSQYKELLLALNEATDIQVQAEPLLDPEPPKKARTASVDKDPLDPRYFQARTRPDTFDFTTGHDGWSMWKDSWDVFKITSGLADLTVGDGDQAERDARKATLIEKEWFLFWESMKPSWNTLKPILPSALRAKRKTNEAIERIDAHINGNTSYRMARRHFGRRMQRNGEPLDDWVADLTNLAGRCKFQHKCQHCDRMSSTIDERIAEQLTTGVYQIELAHKLLELPNNATLEDVKQMAHSYEVTRNATSSWTRSTATNNRVAAGRGAPPKKDATSGPGKQGNTKSQQTCGNCKWGASSHVGGQCPASKQTCYGCGRMGHIHSKCRSQKNNKSNKPNGPAPTQARAVDSSPFEEEPAKEEEVAYQPTAHTMAAFSAHTTHTIPAPERLQQVGVQIRPTSRPGNPSVTLQALPDTGSNVDVLPASQLKRMGIAHHDLPNWRNPPPAPNTAAGTAQWKTWGTLEATISRDGQATDRHIYIIEGADVPLLSKATCVGLGFIPKDWPRTHAQATRTYAQVTAGRD